ncbi:glycosyltransferase [Neolewinella lacunae]|uniref:Glycosyltransferase n=1 Tax=Neolewinella lacunae TaxID=1517758 RepID=A0A923PJD4_9BACT|nr:glycosyltransferase [Neolewinella lacunae]MBC6992806.1 glycosyltransferase [Neolewinella lacunae]MDN3636105.1 glycosyltransferase [Neolewinella lacunae]
MEQPLFSIVIPTHNRAAQLPAAIQSVLDQSYPHWELIVVDDGSTDGTASTVAAFTDPRIRYHYQENRQLNGARNSGVGLARGEFLGFLDDDDLLQPGHLAVLHAAMREDKFQHPIYRSGLILRGKSEERGVNYVNGQDALAQYWAHPAGLFGMLIRRDLLRARPFDEDLLLLDDFLWLSAVLVEHPLYQVAAHTAVVNLHPAQRSATYLDEQRLQDNIRRLAAAYNLPGVPQRVPFEFYRRQVVHQHLHFTRQLERNGQLRAALGSWWKALSYARWGDWRELGATLGKVFFALF